MSRKLKDLTIISFTKDIVNSTDTGELQMQNKSPLIYKIICLNILLLLKPCVHLFGIFI